jgi:hypothetical protein
MLHHRQWRVFWLTLVCVGIALAPAPVARAATIVIVNNDGAGEGFNDPTAAAPVGGNTGTTIGAQRLIAFQRAADIWAARLKSSVTIRVRAQFNVLSCDAMSATLGSAGAITFFRDFSGAPVAGTWFPVALANALNGADLEPGVDDINATFNSAIGTTCAFPIGWYYGLDGNAGGDIDFISVLLHELGHGLGFGTLVDLPTGAKALGFDDTFMRNLENHGATPSDYPSMSNAQRVAASIATGNLHWTGANVRATSGFLSSGTVGDHVRMFAPNPQQPGSSVSHFDTVLSPSQMMEPFYTAPLQNPVLELPLFQDIGWTVLRAAHDFNGDGKSDILWRQSSTGAVAVWLMNGAAVVQTGGLGVVANTWSIAGQRDFDSSARHDLLWRNTSGGTFIWFLNGLTVPSTANIGTVTGTWTVVGTGDFNGDGRGDLLWRDASGNTAIWLMNGAQLVQSAVISQVGAPWSIVGTADFNGDGKADILWRDATTGAIAIWLMNGVQIIATATHAVSGSWNVAATGDFNGNGKADIAWRDASGNVAIWLMNGTLIAQTGLPGFVPTTYLLAATGDYNGDGKADLLWRHTPTGDVTMWFMNGVLAASSAFVSNVSSDWVIQATNAN